MMDFRNIKKLFIGGVELKELFIGNKFDNKVPKSIDTDGSIYQSGKGYIEGYRLSSSGSLSSQANTVTTGFIPCKSTDLIRMAGVEWLPTIAGTYTYISFFDTYFGLLGSLNCQKSDQTGTGYIGVPRGIVQFENETDNATSSELIPTKENGVYIMDQYRFKSDADKVAYFRINGYGSGADMIVTINEEIGMRQVWKSGYKNWVEYSTEADGITTYNGGLGYKDGYRVRSGGAETTATECTITGFIPLKRGETLRIYPPFTGKNTQNAINFYGPSFGILGQITDEGIGYGICDDKVELYKSTVIDGVSTLTLTDSHDSSIAFVRITNAIGVAYGSPIIAGADMIVTVNEKIE